jgi:hypothetical protein
MINSRCRQDLLTLNVFSRRVRGCFLVFSIFAVVLFLSLDNHAFAQSDLAEIEFWQSVKTSQDPAELEAYLDLYPQGKFAPLARLRIKKLSPDTAIEPASPARQTSPPPPPIELPVFKPEVATDAICRRRLGDSGYAAADFGGTGSVCLCRTPFEISGDGASCVRTAPVNLPPQKKARKSPEQNRPARVKRKPAPVRVKRKSVKRPPKARARAIANSYCRRRYGANLRSVVVKKSKFYCHYTLGEGNYLAVKKKKFKDVSQ